MRPGVERLHALNEDVVIPSIQTLSVPHVPAADRRVIDDLGYGVRSTISSRSTTRSPLNYRPP
jgi:hypothetical protein